MIATARTCSGCGSELKGTGRAKWCSERCRKQTLYGGVCVDCGAQTSGSEGNGPNAPKRCQRARLIAANHEVWSARREMVERMWCDGFSSREIARAAGVSEAAAPSFIGVCRYRGWDLPVRNQGSSDWLKAHPEHTARMREARARAR